MQYPETNHIKDETQANNANLFPKIVDHTVATEKTIVSEQIEKEQDKTVGCENTPIWQRIAAEIPVKEFMYDLHNHLALSFFTI
ncbi:MAG: hypothetical protein ACI3YM_06305 [Prevotella sp.]|nr:hypothetical protein [Prevotella sp.]